MGSLANRVVEQFWQGGLEAIAKRTRKIEAEGAATAHTDYREGTGIAPDWSRR